MIERVKLWGESLVTRSIGFFRMYFKLFGKRNNSKRYSLKLSSLFQDNLKQIAKHPGIGRKTNEEHVRFRIVKDYFIYYTYNNFEILVISLCDMRRNPQYIKSLLKYIMREVISLEVLESHTDWTVLIGNENVDMLNVSSLDQGVYFLRVTVSGRLFSELFVEE